jgi:hypothetical protein
MKPYIQLEDFMFSEKFVDLTEVQLGKALQIVNAQFSGVYSLWAFLPPDERDAKRKLCINYLVAWQLAMLYPEQAILGSGSGGIPLKSKKIDYISLQYRDVVRAAGSGVLDILTTNEWGMEALVMIQSAPENYILRRAR